MYHAYCKMNLLTFFLIYYYIQSLFTSIHTAGDSQLVECLHHKTNTTNYLASRTPYRIHENKNITPFDIVPDECVPIQIWMLIRHGCRYPDLIEIIEMNDRLPQLKIQILKHQTKGTLCANEIERFEKWNIQVKPADEKRLTEQGEKELRDFAKRIKKRFPTLFNRSFSNDSYVFRSKSSQHLQENARSFAKAVYEERYNSEVEVSDTILDFYRLCAKWLTDVKINGFQEMSYFLINETYQAVLHDVAARLGIPEISIGDLVLMYKTCQYETSWMENDVSPWCVIFSESNLQVLEYVPDLIYFYKYGYGLEDSRDQACPLMQDMLGTFRKAEESSTLKGTFNFSSSGTILKLLSYLGLYRDETLLLHSNFERYRDHRHWRVSHIDTCLANFAAVLHRCGNDDYRVLMLNQERVTNVPGCPKDQLCPLNTLRENFATCNFDEICGNELNWDSMEMCPNI